MEKQQQLLFDKGITNIPSDALCSDNALAESIGMVHDDGEYRVIQKPVEYMNGIYPSYVLIYVHKINNTEHFIMRDTSTNPDTIKWGTMSGSGQYVPETEGSSSAEIILREVTGEVQITSIGNTLIITDEQKMMYFKWDSGSYKNIVYPIPDLQFEAKLVNTELGLFTTNSGIAEYVFPDFESYDPYSLADFKIAAGQQETYNDLVTGLYAKNLKELAQNKMFAEPFFVRAALELYDGSYTYITNPILLFPSIENNTIFAVRGLLNADGSNFIPLQLVSITQGVRLFIKQGRDFSDYSDIVKDVVVFASQGVNIYKTNEDQRCSPRLGEDVGFGPTTAKFVCGEGVWSYDTVTEEITESEHRTSYYDISLFTLEGHDELEFSTTCIRGLTKRERKAIDEDLESVSVFYKIASLGLKSIRNFVDIGTKTTGEVLENLTTQEFLEYDDYFSRSSLVPKFSYVYNARLNLANVSRSFFKGFSFFTPLDQSSPVKYTFDVTIKTDAGNVSVIYSSMTEQKQGIYFYYPDSRANHVRIYKHSTGSMILDAELKEHPGLNGAYYFGGFGPTTDEPAGTPSVIPSDSLPLPEQLYNYLIQSEVNNPWVFISKGYNAISTGDIIGMSTITQALSEGQFGQYPLLVFTETGIWAMSVDGTGLYSSIHPMSREVCCNASTITQTDGAVFFGSEKGLMAVVGNQVKCVSEQLSGREDSYAASMFPTKRLGSPMSFFKNCHIAYDYRDSLLWLFSNSGAASCCYIYSIKNGTFSKFDNVSLVKCVNNYPDYLIQVPNRNNAVYSLINRPDINSDYSSGTNYKQYSASMLTRPMKLENALALKTITQLRNIKQFSPYEITDTSTNPATVTPYMGTVKVRLFASNNLKSWIELHSLRGMPWKYYRLRYDFENLIATDRFAGTMIVTQERRTDKMR